MEEIGTYLISAFIGIGLATATGFRVFLPLFFVSLASYFNWLPLSDSWAWLGSVSALIVLGIAMLVEILAYYIPFIDNLLDTISIPLATVAGTMLFASQFSEANQIVQWGLGIIAGGGTAATISSTMTGLRAGSSASTGGLGNPVVSTVENTGSIVMSIIALVLPIFGIILVVVLLYYIFRYGRKFWQKTQRQK